MLANAVAVFWVVLFLYVIAAIAKTEMIIRWGRRNRGRFIIGDLMKLKGRYFDMPTIEFWFKVLTGNSPLKD